MSLPSITISRDSVVWTVGLVSSILGYLAADQSHVAWAHHAQDALVVVGLISAFFKASPAPSQFQVDLRKQVSGDK